MCFAPPLLLGLLPVAPLNATQLGRFVLVVQWSVTIGAWNSRGDFSPCLLGRSRRSLRGLFIVAPKLPTIIVQCFVELLGREALQRWKGQVCSSVTCCCESVFYYGGTRWLT